MAKKTPRRPRVSPALEARLKASSESLDRAIAAFQAINRDAALSEEEKERRKETYLKDIFGPELRRIVESGAAESK